MLTRILYVCLLGMASSAWARHNEKGCTMQEILTSEWLLEFQCLLGWCCALAHLPHSVSYVIEGFHCKRTISQSHLSLTYSGNRHKKFDFIDQIVCNQEAHVVWAQDYRKPMHNAEGILGS